MVEPMFKEKFIAFVDILGFKSLVAEAECGGNISLAELLEAVDSLGRQNIREQIKEFGPIICPDSQSLSNDLDFEITQVSDCVIVSAEKSPCGIINLVNHCWGGVLQLLTKGLLCRGYITHGKIHHQGNWLLGSGYQMAYSRESSTKAFARDADERGTPFVEIDEFVCRYVKESGDKCVNEMFSRFTKIDENITAVFPFHRLSHQFVIGSSGGIYQDRFCADKEKRGNHVVRKWINDMKMRIIKFADHNNESAMEKTRHYINALDEQLRCCDRTDEIIERLSSPFGRRTNVPFDK